MSLPLGNGPRSLGIFYNLGGTTQELLPHVSSCMWLVSRLLDSKGIAVVPKVTEPENFVSGPQASLLCVLKASWNFPGGLLVKNRPRVRYLGQTMQGTRVQSLVLEDPICHGAATPGHHNYWAWALHREPVLCNKRSPCNEQPHDHNERKPRHSNDDPAQTKINNLIFS